MPSIAALGTVIVIVLALLTLDARRATGTTRALWVPFIWLTIISSRFVSEWINPGATAAPQDGSPIDQPVFLVLLVGAAAILSRRNIAWSRLPAANIALTIFLAYGAVSIFWSDFPFVAFKRWVKVLGHVLMVMIVFSEPLPIEALRALFRRVAFVLLPSSILLIKYFPEYGRGFSSWTGAAVNTGVTTNKNSLGVLCLMAGFFAVWTLVAYRGRQAIRLRSFEAFSALAVLAMVLWLLNLAHSVTSVVALTVGVLTVIALSSKQLREGRLALYAAVGALMMLAVDAQLSLTESALAGFGRDATLTDRTELWQDVLALTVNPLVGAGFESFWLGDRLSILWEKWPWKPNQAHSGYLESYLNGGWIGVAALMLLIVSCYQKAKASLISTPAIGRLRMGCLALIIVYNYAEAANKALHPLFFLLFLIAFDFPARSTEATAVPTARMPLRRWGYRGETERRSRAPLARRPGVAPPVGRRPSQFVVWSDSRASRSLSSRYRR